MRRMRMSLMSMVADPLLNTDYADCLHPIGDYVFDDLDQFIGLRQTKRFLPQTFGFVADDDNVGVIVFGFDVLAQLVKRPVEVLFFAGEKNPAGTGVKTTP